MATIKNNNVGKNAGKLVLFCTVGGNENGAATAEKSMAVPQKIKNRIYHMIQQFHFWLYTQKN